MAGSSVREASELSTKAAHADPDTDKKNDPIKHPGTVIINVQGAFIVDDAPPAPNGSGGTAQEEFVHQTHDIRLPNHKAVVSHIAVDVRRIAGM